LPNRYIRLACDKPNHLGYSDNPQTLGEHLRKRRLELGLLQKEVAQRIGSCVASVWLWEAGRAQPQLKWIPAILSFIGHDVRPIPQTLSAQLVTFRTGRGWSQKRLAAELHVDPTTLSRWERGKGLPLGVYAQRIHGLLFVRVHRSHYPGIPLRVKGGRSRPRKRRHSGASCDRSLRVIAATVRAPGPVRLQAFDARACRRQVDLSDGDGAVPETVSHDELVVAAKLPESSSQWLEIAY
jgi:transcriptional regulator with XRE-family HTH domain